MSNFFNKAVMSHSFFASDWDVVNLRSLDRSGKALHAGYTAGATAPTKITERHGVDFDGGQYFEGGCNGQFNQPEISMCFCFKPDFLVTNAVYRFLIDTDSAGRYYVIHNSAGEGFTLEVYLGDVSVLNIAQAVYEPFWKVDQYNTLVVTGRTGNNEAWLNKNLIGTSATAWTAKNPVNYTLGSRYTYNNLFLGSMRNVDIFPFRMTPTQAIEWHNQAIQNLNLV